MKFKELLTRISPLPWLDQTGNVDGAVSFKDPEINQHMNLCKTDAEGYFRLQKDEDAEFVTKLANAAPKIEQLLLKLQTNPHLHMDQERLLDELIEELEIE